MLIGVDIGGTNLRVGVVDDMQLVYQHRTHADFSHLCKTNPPDIAWQEIIRITRDALLDALLEFPQVTSIGIGFPGFIDPANGRIAQSPNLSGLLDVDLASPLARAIERPVIIENDALAAAYGEFRLSPTSAGSLVYLGLGTGVGGGLIVDGKTFTGQHGFAMEVGHMIVEPSSSPNGRLCGCGNYGCLEQFASASGVTLSYQLATGNVLTTDKIAALAEAGNKEAIDAYNLAGITLAQVVAHIAKVVDVGEVVIGGGMSQAWPLMQAAFEQRLHTDLIPVLRGTLNTRISSSGDRAGIIGAALLSSLATSVNS